MLLENNLTDRKDMDIFLCTCENLMFSQTCRVSAKISTERANKPNKK